ncbi:MAG: YggS family pyridoxal phosphate-dependent enzyme [Bacteroidetes bacterium CG18_big_fil_WC_8_21_14_2_50_41_14]|nr:MAG: YggS family pyridoxal phosphate-dependent enzyme [Bacteroidetes bacterium CG18_big_fil_WC_8_21_14_2_50_41_14]PJB59828.1 MAG: YggS family pyridoxal phosphate-dependent enzyme [Bacteroidetes bacterium CG_4_9_14_3_um_filter_41_19]
MSIQQNLNHYRQLLPPKVTLVAVTKTKPVEDIKEAYDAGQRIFGENKAQDMAAKYPLLPLDIEWHFIGHLQTNKVKTIASFVKLIHAIDSLKLLSEINKQAAENQRVIDCLLQFHIAEEETKFGLNYDEAREILSSETFKKMENIRLTGVMGMASLTDDTKQVAREFDQLSSIYHQLKSGFFPSSESFKELSMGMSDDFQIAIKAGSTLIRIGTGIFGKRNY